MNYRERIRKAIECPQFGGSAYGEWGALTLEQRKLIKRLLDELDTADAAYKDLYIRNRKAIEYINENVAVYAFGNKELPSWEFNDNNIFELLKILKGEE